MTKPNEVGIGKPSKNLALPVSSFGAKATVALKRARRAIPQQMKTVKQSVSSVVRRPIQYALWGEASSHIQENGSWGAQHTRKQARHQRKVNRLENPILDRAC